MPSVTLRPLPRQCPTLGNWRERGSAATRLAPGPPPCQGGCPTPGAGLGTVPPRLECWFSACLLPSLTKPLLGNAVAKTVSTMGMSPSHGVTSGQDIPVPTTLSPKKGEGGVGGMWKCKNQHCSVRKEFLPALRCREGGSARWEQQPRGKLVSFTESPVPAGRFGDQKPPGNCVMQPPQLSCCNGSSACSWLHFGVPPPAASQHRGHRQVPGPGAATKGLGRWHSRGSGQLLIWVSSCLPAARPTAPLDVLCHLQNTAAGTDPAWPTAPRQGEAVELRHGRCPGEEGLRRRERRWP